MFGTQCGFSVETVVCSERCNRSGRSGYVWLAGQGGNIRSHGRQLDLRGTCRHSSSGEGHLKAGRTVLFRILCICRFLHLGLVCTCLSLFRSGDLEILFCIFEYPLTS